MKAVIIAAAVALAFPALAQQTPNAQERAENREKVQNQAEKAQDKLPGAEQRAQNREKVQDKLPTAEERAKNRDKVATTASNATLTTKVKSALAKGEGAKTMTNINVDSDNGVVTLKGKVDSAEMKKKAGEIAKQVDGVKSVKNELRVEKKS